jgi:nucleoside-diphosphate-sugar epimerase
MGINEMVHNALEGKKTEIPMLAPNRRTHTVYAKDTAEATCSVHLAGSLKHYIYNVADGTHPTMQEIVTVIEEVIPDAEIQLGQPGEEVAIKSQSMDRIKDELGFVPKTLKDGIKAYVTFLKEGEY